MALGTGGHETKQAPGRAGPHRYHTASERPAAWTQREDPTLARRRRQTYARGFADANIGGAWLRSQVGAEHVGREDPRREVPAPVGLPLAGNDAASPRARSEQGYRARAAGRGGAWLRSARQSRAQRTPSAASAASRRHPRRRAGVAGGCWPAKFSRPRRDDAPVPAYPRLPRVPGRRDVWRRSLGLQAGRPPSRPLRRARSMIGAVGLVDIEASRVCTRV